MDNELKNFLLSILVLIIIFSPLLRSFFRSKSENEEDVKPEISRKQKFDNLLKEVLGKETFDNYIYFVKTIFYKSDGTYDDINSYDSQINYEKSSFIYVVYEYGKRIFDITIEIDANNQIYYDREELMALKVYLEDETLVRYWQLIRAFKMIYPNRDLYFTPKLCKTTQTHETYEIVYKAQEFVWSTYYEAYLPPSDNKYIPYLIGHEIYINPKNPYDFFIKSSPRYKT